MTCECGCGEDALNGSFKPGHDQKLRIALERRVGGLINMRALIESVENFNETNDSPRLAAKISSIFESR